MVYGPSLETSEKESKIDLKKKTSLLFQTFELDPLFGDGIPMMREALRQDLIRTVWTTGLSFDSRLTTHAKITIKVKHLASFCIFFSISIASYRPYTLL